MFGELSAKWLRVGMSKVKDIAMAVLAVLMLVVFCIGLSMALLNADPDTRRNLMLLILLQNQ